MNDMEWVAKWLSKAQGDLTAAQRLLNDFHPPQLDISCYHSQQCAEKALKGYLTFKNHNFPFIHDLEQLCLLCINYDNSFNKLLNNCVDLTPYATQTRYPDEIEIEDQDAKNALIKAERIFAFVDDIISDIDNHKS